MKHSTFRSLIPILFLLIHAAGAGEPKGPNVLFILADQWRAQAFSHAGDPNVKTPHIDALQRESVVLIFGNSRGSGMISPGCREPNSFFWTPPGKWFTQRLVNSTRP